MKRITSLLAASLIATGGCLGLHNAKPVQPPAKSSLAAAPARPPVTEDQVTEENASAAARALSEELSRDASEKKTALSPATNPARR